MKKELLELDYEKFNEEIPLLDFIYIIPTRRKHDSGYNIMEIIGENKEGYKKKLVSFSDIIDINNLIGNSEWLISIDIPEYNVIRLFSHKAQFRVTTFGISTFEFELVERNY